MVVTAEGEIPAPDGVHELEGGVKVQTTDGIVVKVEEAVMEEEAMEEESVEVEVPSEGAPIAEPVVDAIVEAIVHCWLSRHNSRCDTRDVRRQLRSGALRVCPRTRFSSSDAMRQTSIVNGRILGQPTRMDHSLRRTFGS
jgi:hypothetical protein